MSQKNKKFIKKINNQKNFKNDYEKLEVVNENKKLENELKDKNSFLLELDENLRPVDWRWRLANKLVNKKVNFEVVKYNQNIILDKDFIEIVLFVNALKNNNFLKISKNFAKLSSAWKIKFFYSSLSNNIEARILGGEEDFSIAYKLNIDVDVLKKYKKMFFDVDNKLENPLYIINCVIKFEENPSIEKFNKLVAYCCGYSFFENNDFVNRINFEDFEDIIRDKIKNLGLVKMISGINANASGGRGGFLESKEQAILLTKYITENLNINQTNIQNQTNNFNLFNEIKSIIEKNPMFDIFEKNNESIKKLNYKQEEEEKKVNSEIFSQIKLQIEEEQKIKENQNGS